MCTVTYIPKGLGYYLTSNRDEHFNRPLAILPNMNQYQEDGIWYPKDGGAGGSWIALKQNGTSAVLLNGAFEKHIKLQSYRLSRGLIFLSIIKHQDLLKGFMNENLEEIEPFTLILKTQFGLHECIWDGKQKYQQEKDPATAHIWSSCTLYHKEVRNKREAYFENWLKLKSPVYSSLIAAFHQSKPFADDSENFMMKRLDGISTVSITSLKVDSGQAEINYLDHQRSLFEPIYFELNLQKKQK
ncbi:MAG: NRDE family protein [Sediminibacterium sp.]